MPKSELAVIITQTLVGLLAVGELAALKEVVEELVFLDLCSACTGSSIAVMYAVALCTVLKTGVVRDLFTCEKDPLALRLLLPQTASAVKILTP